MKKEMEKRDINLDHDIKTDKVTIQYLRTIEIQREAIPTKAKELASIIAQMEYHYQKLGADIESAKKELQLLQQFNE